MTLPRTLTDKLWAHQKNALEFVVHRLRGGASPRAVLVRMPTGTGKTGIIAVLSVADWPKKWTLVLTPWANLCDQMIGDLGEKFWQISKWRPSPAPKVERLLPSTATELLSKKDEHLILVSTFATLVTIFKKASTYNALAAKISEVFVDEGHYEPAVEWGQAVKQLKAPTLLLTATPYRNDLKLFRVRAEDVFHFTHLEAEEKGIVRKLKFREMSATEPHSLKELVAWCDEFVDYWNKFRAASRATDARAIVCCDSMATVKSVTTRLNNRGIKALGIHDRFKAEKKSWLVKETPEPNAVDFEVWVHQHKLTEGLDDKRFRVLAIVNRIRNDRKLIQQIGRILRRSPGDSEPAVVLFSSGLQIKRSWDNYRDFETQPNLNDPLRYRRLLDSLLNAQPSMEYFGGQFRSRFDSASDDLKSQIRLLPSVLARQTLPDFDWGQATEFITDFLELEDCILLGPEQGYETGNRDSRLWTYAIFGNSPILISGSQYEIRLGAMAAVLHGDMLFLSDTEGKYPDVYLPDHTRKLSPDDLGKILSEKTVPHEVSLQNPWPAGPSVRRSSIYASDLGTTSPQLTDSAYMCTSVRASAPATVALAPPRRHYLGFSRGRVSEELESTTRTEFNLQEFVSWTRELALSVQSQSRRMPEFFSRYLIPVQAPSVVSATYLVINLYQGEAVTEDEAGHQLQLKETIIALKPEDDRDGVSRFSGVAVSFRASNSDEQIKLRFRLIYHSKSHRFTLQSELWNSAMFVQSSERNERQGIVNFLNRNDEAFTVALADPHFFYNGQSFYRIDYSYAETRLASLLSTEPILARVTGEKGTFRPRQKNWNHDSLFGVIDRSAKDGILAKHFPESDFVFCDDLGKEVADFVAVSFEKKRIALIHAKHGDGNLVSASALHVVVAQAAKNLGVLGRAGPPPPEIERWRHREPWSTSSILRWRQGAARLPELAALWQKIRTEILDHPYGKKEVWLVVSATLNRTRLLAQMSDPKLRTPVAGQLLHLLSTLYANCAQVQIGLRVFCD